MDTPKDPVKLRQVPDKPGRYFEVTKGGKPHTTAHSPEPIHCDAADQVVVDGEVWSTVDALHEWKSDVGTLIGITYTKKTDGDTRTTYRTSDCVIVRKPDPGLKAAKEALEYFRSCAKLLPQKDPVLWPLGKIESVDKDSALAAYLSGEDIASISDPPLNIYPFGTNASQTQAQEVALAHQLSIIEGPPGTGKTNTILNIVSSIIADTTKTVAVVSCTNSAVENVREKLEARGMGFLVADLGNKDKCEYFFKRQGIRNADLRRFLNQPETNKVDIRAYQKMGKNLQALRLRSQRLALNTSKLQAYQLELAHFDRIYSDISSDTVETTVSPEVILEHLARHELKKTAKLSVRDRLTWAVKKLFIYRNLPSINPQDPDVYQRLKRAYYVRHIEQLEEQISSDREFLAMAGFDEAEQSFQLLSTDYLHAALRTRYQGKTRTNYLEKQKYTAAFADDYPLLVSTCYSVGRHLPSSELLDYIIIDEASQVDPMVATLALAKARNAIIVGDHRQLAPVVSRSLSDAKDRPIPPHPFLDCTKHSILTSLQEMHAHRVPSTLLREHYRCAPEIIEFCNRMFYDDQLIPYTESDPDGNPAISVMLTASGNHMRKHHAQGNINLRELEAIAQEVLPKVGVKVPAAEVGVVTPFRGQVEEAERRFSGAMPEGSTNTVHKYQGREKDTIIISVVLDETKRANMSKRFADDARLVNVAVSRAKKSLVVVADNSTLPRTKYFNSLINYSHYQNPGSTEVSKIVSVFDLLYQDYSPTLNRLRGKLKETSKYQSERIVYAVLDEILSEEQNRHLSFQQQIRLIDLLPTLDGLTDRQRAFVRHGNTSVDFVVYNRVSKRALVVIEVDGFAYHANNPEQLSRDAMKDELLKPHGLKPVRLPTHGSGEEEKIRQALRDHIAPTITNQAHVG